MIAEIIGADGKVHYRRPFGDPAIEESRKTPGYSVRFTDEVGQVQKPLFIPLRTQWFNAFKSGEKTKEYRAFGPRWNERTCFLGRPTIVSHGYSGDRLYRKVKSIFVMPGVYAPEEAKAVFPKAAIIIEIELI